MQIILRFGLVHWPETKEIFEAEGRRESSTVRNRMRWTLDSIPH